MFSFGWSEIALTVIIIIIVVGPKEIHNLLRQIGYFSKSIVLYCVPKIGN